MRKHVSFKKPTITKTLAGNYTIAYKNINGLPGTRHTKVYATEQEALDEYNDYIIESFINEPLLLHKLPKCITFVNVNKRFKFDITINGNTRTLFSSNYLYEVIRFRNQLLENILGIN